MPDNLPETRPSRDGGAFLAPAGANAPVGVFDSGIGGLSVLRHIRTLLPNEQLLYVADSGFAPYGEKSEAEVVARTLAIAEFLLAQGIKALVVACNTATAAAVVALRQRYPSLLVIGVEPGLKPAALLTVTRIVGVLATANTLASARFAALHGQIAEASGVRFLLQACNGLADQVEKGALRSAATATLVQRYVGPLVAQGADTLVLGCTHYPFVQELIEAAAARATDRPVSIINTGDAVARQLSRLLTQQALQRQSDEAGAVTAFTTGSHTALESAFANLLKVRLQVISLATPPDSERAG